MSIRHDHSQILRDIVFVIFSILVAIIFVRTQALTHLLDTTKHLQILGSFISGLFFTSIFTTPPAIVALSQISAHGSLITTAFFGALGAVIGDLIIFRFVRDRFSEHLTDMLTHSRGMKRIGALFRNKSFRWFTFFFGGLIIASPLPDEFGITLLGFSKMRTSWFVPLSFVFNFIGILLIGMIAR